MADLLVIVGPTAVGKTDLALGLADELPIEVVNADSLQAYRELEIGTAKPSAEQRDAVPHHLIDILPPDQAFSAGEFARLARTAIDDIHRRERIPVVVGGSGFYLRALIDGLAPLPRVPGEVRYRVKRELNRLGSAALWRRLRRVDAEFAHSIDPNDGQRVSRGLEIYEATGTPLGEWHRQTSVTPSRSVCWLGLTLPRRTLYDRIHVRTERMLRQGWLGEVRTLTAKYGADAPAFQAIGYRTLISVLEHRLTLEQAAETITRDTRRYAKRQLTWFRRDRRIRWLEPANVGEALNAWRGNND